MIARPAGLEPAEQVRALTAQYSTLTDATQAQQAAGFIRLVRQKIATIKAVYKKTREPFDEAMKRSRQMEKDDLQAWDEANTAIANALLTWQAAEKERLRVESQRLLDEATARAEAERARQAEALRAAAAEASTQREARALTQQARAVAKAPVMPVVTAPVPATVKLEGVHTQERWSAEVDDAEALFKAVARGTISREALIPNQDWLDGQAVTMQKNLTIPGVRAVLKPVLVARR